MNLFIFIFLLYHTSGSVVAEGMFTDEELVSKLAKASTEFALDFYKHLAITEKNVFVSPASILTALAMIRLGARDNTQSQIDQVLRWTTFSDKLNDAFKDYLSILNTETSYNLTVAIRMFIHSRIKVLDEFVNKTEKYFLAGAVLADFAGNPDRERRIINEWVQKQTNGKINSVISDSIDSLTRLILVNAIYFKGTWEQKFDPADIEKGDFKISPSVKTEVDMMKLIKTFRTGKNENLKCQVLELPYVQRHLSMFILLPLDDFGLQSLEGNLSFENLRNALSEIQKQTVDIRLPKFVLESTFALEKILPFLGITDAFDETRANFSGIANTADLYLSQMIHQTLLEVNEEGSEAAATSAARIQARSLPVIYPFIVDHPFFFLIRDNRANMILFLGKLEHPKGPQMISGKQEL